MPTRIIAQILFQARGNTGDAPENAAERTARCRPLRCCGVFLAAALAGRRCRHLAAERLMLGLLVLVGLRLLGFLVAAHLALGHDVLLFPSGASLHTAAAIVASTRRRV
jgi:hypothetical protein